MSRTWHLGGRWYAPGPELGIAGGGCTWRVLEDEDDGSRWILQSWSPRPPDRDLDMVRETYLQWVVGAEGGDPPASRFGFDEGQVWFLQKLLDPVLRDCWPRWRGVLQEAFLARLRSILAKDPHPRLVHPAAISVQAGRILLPRVIGAAPLGWKAFEASLGKEIGAQPGPGAWELPPDLSDKLAVPVRGRGRELTYLKSLVLGLASSARMERILVLEGEEGMGLSVLGKWATAVAETESIWVKGFEIQHGEKAGVFLGRMLQGLLKGFEAELYASSPETARTLARRLPTYAFLNGGRRLAEDAPVEPQELLAALRILEFLAGRHPRLIRVECAERADAELQAVLRELAMHSGVAWLLCVTLQGAGSPVKGLLSPLRVHPAAAFLHLNRLEDHDLLDLMDDLLQPNDLDPGFRAEACQASLGSPGMLRRILENAQMEGILVWRPDRGWSLAPDRPPRIRVHEDLEGRVLAGRMHRLEAAPTAVLRLLALADRPLALPALGRALGLAGDPLDETLRSATSSKLALVKEGTARLAGPRVRALVLEAAPESEARRLAKALLKALGDEIDPVLSLHLEARASDERTVLERVLRMAGQEVVPRPADAEEIVSQALGLHPSPAQTARLWEFLSDAWSQATVRGRVPSERLGQRSPWEMALEALGKAQACLGAGGGPAPGEDRGLLARLFRKQALLEVRIRRLDRALGALQSAAGCLADQPGHSEQVSLRLALGRVHLLQGDMGKGLKVLEEGLRLATASGAPGAGRWQMELLLEMAKTQAHRCQFQRSLATLHAAQRTMEHDQDFRRLASVLDALAQTCLALGQPEAVHGHLQGALRASRIQDDLELQGTCHLDIGIFESCRQALGSALSHLDKALDRFAALRDRVGIARAQAWKARTLAALGEAAQGEMLLLRALEGVEARSSVSERGELLFLQAELAAFQGSWRDAARTYLEAARGFEGAGLAWRELLSRLRHVQSLARGGLSEGFDQAWDLLERCKVQVEGAGSRWLEMEWHRAHALLLSTVPDGDDGVAMESLTALGDMLAAAREIQFPAEVLEASALEATLLLRRGESLGARSRLQDACASFQQLWSGVPETMGASFLGRPDIRRFRTAVETAGLGFSIPEREDPMLDWAPTQVLDAPQ